MAKHELKTWPEYFEMIKQGCKTFEIRRDDRDYKTGDTLVLLEYDPVGKDYTTRYITCEVLGVNDLCRIQEEVFGIYFDPTHFGYPLVIMSIGNIDLSNA